MKKYHGTMVVRIHNKDQSQAMVFDGIDNAYIKAGFYCLVNRDKNTVQKFPIENIFRVVEPYNPDRED